MGNSLINEDEFECNRDWLHQITSELVQLEDQRLSIERSLNQLAISNEDVQEILVFVDALPLAQQDELAKFAISSRILVNEKKSSSILEEQLVEFRQHKIKGHFRNRVLSFNV